MKLRTRMVISGKPQKKTRNYTLAGLEWALGGAEKAELLKGLLGEIGITPITFWYCSKYIWQI